MTAGTINQIAAGLPSDPTTPAAFGAAAGGTPHTRRRAAPFSPSEGLVCIPLKGGFVTVVDKEDAERLAGYRWSAQQYKSRFYVIAKEPGTRRNVRLHRLIMEAKAGQLVDHIDGDTLNNRKSNLRLCTDLENCRNRGPVRNKAVPFKGVRLERDGLFRATIRVDGVTKELGRFKTAEEAHAAYCNAADECFGEFSYNSRPKHISNHVQRDWLPLRKRKSWPPPVGEVA